LISVTPTSSPTAWTFPRALLCAAALAVLAPNASHAQDVLEQGRVRGVRAPDAVTAELQRDPTAFEFKRAWRNKVRRVRAQREAVEARQGLRLSATQIRAAGAAVVGTMRVPVLLGLPSGVAPPYTAAQYQTRLFGDVAGTYSLKTFYRELSRGVFTLDGNVSGWLPLPQTAAYYYPSATTDPTFGRDREFLRDALTAADPGINFALFDNDGFDGVPNSGDDDGYVDAAAFVYPAHGKACGGPGIWPHRWTYTAQWGAPFSTNDPSASGGMIKVDDYLIQGGVECDGTSLMEIGTMAHEMGHALALPDLYDTDGGNGRTEGLGEWDLMGSGNYRRPEAPAHMGAWSKDFLGWVGVEPVTSPSAGVSLEPVYTAGRVLRYDLPGTREYFLMEHRAATGSDRNVHGPGLLVYHVDEAVLDSTLYLNRVNANPRRGVDLEEADGLDHLDLASGGNRGDAGDPFPGSAARTAFGRASYPSSRSNAGLASGFELRNIALAGGRVTFDLGDGAPGPVATVTVSPPAVEIVLGMMEPLTATLQDSTGVQIFGRTVIWTSTNTAVATVTQTGEVTAKAAGTATINASSDGKRGTARVTVVEPPSISPGDSATGEITDPGHRYPHLLKLTAGTVVDVGVFRTGGDPNFHPVVAFKYASTTPNVVYRDSQRGTILARYTVETTGFYDLEVWSRTDGMAGTYILRTRISGPVLATTGGAVPPPSRREGSSSPPVRDTVWVYNAGSGSTSFTVHPGSSPWLSATPLSGSSSAAGAASPAREAPRDDAPPLAANDGQTGRAAEDAPRQAGPAGAVPVEITMDMSGLARGYYRDTVVVRSTATDVWNHGWTLYRQVRVYDPRIQILSTTLTPGRLALSPAGDLVMARSTDVARVDKTTGASSTWAAGASSVNGMQFGPDSALYLAIGTASQGRVARVERSGTVTTLFTTSVLVRDLAVLPDGTIFAVAGGNLLRRGRDGVVTTVLSSERAELTWSLAYNPADGWLYYFDNAVLRRYHPSTGVDEMRGRVPSLSNAPIIELAVGRDGRLYGSEYHGYQGAVVVVDTSAALVERLWQPTVGFGLVLDEGKLFGSGLSPTWTVWALAVSDGPPGSPVLRGDPNRDGAITAQDALGVLADVVGKPLPAGWNVALGGDADCDGQITALDALIILSRVVGKDVSQFCIGTAR
jgi:M6 family metalloprotease-like protein